MSDAFISYAREEKDFVRDLCSELKKRDKEVWVDLDDIPGTAKWWEEVEDGIASADAFLVVISPASIASEVCAREVATAADLNKRIVPLVRRETDGVPVPEELASRNWIFLRARPRPSATGADRADHWATAAGTHHCPSKPTKQRPLGLPMQRLERRTGRARRLLRAVTA
jgi:hypothetical protein